MASECWNLLATQYKTIVWLMTEASTSNLHIYQNPAGG